MMNKPTLKELFRVAETAKKEKDRRLLKHIIVDLFMASKRYLEIRKAVNETVGSQALGEISQKRRLVHNSLIDCLNILVRNCQERGVDCSWRKRIGDSREEIGDWAVKLVIEAEENKNNPKFF